MAKAGWSCRGLSWSWTFLFYFPVSDCAAMVDTKDTKPQLNAIVASTLFASGGPLLTNRMSLAQVGGGSGIGLATVKGLLKRNVNVAIADLDAQKGAGLVETLNSGRSTGTARATFIQCDITNQESCNSMVKQADMELGTIHYAVNTAGITGPTVEGHEIQETEYRQVMSIDLDGCWRFSKAIITYFRQQEPRLLRDDKGSVWIPVTQRGSLVNVASSLGSLGKPHLAAYCAAKHGVIGLSKALALENATHGIRVNTISPGLTMTPLLATPGFDFEKAKTEYLSDQPMTRFAAPAEIAAGIIFTVMDGASFMTGSDWGPDGGSHVA